MARKSKKLTVSSKDVRWCKPEVRDSKSCRPCTTVSSKDVRWCKPEVRGSKSCRPCTTVQTRRKGFGALGGEYTATELRRRRTLSTGQCDDLKIDTGKTRVWLSRCGVADGEPYEDKVSIEKLRNGRWVVTDEYPG